MLFNSFEFIIFFSVVFTLFFSTKGTSRHLVLFISSCLFYAWFIPYYVGVLFLAIGIDYFSALKIEQSTTEKGRKIGLIFGVVNTCGLLFIFKYYNFFIDTLNTGTGAHFSLLSIALPIGLSFHTFQGLSYVIDVYRKKTVAEKNILAYANYVVMFPQLVAGPIERASHLFPQFEKVFRSSASFSNFKSGMTRFFYGLFKKLVIADNIGPYVDAVYGNAHHHNGSTLLIATILFAFQVYADFSGYSDMAIGLAKTLGFNYNENFDNPFFSKSIAEFWRRWHISLSSWIRDYIYYPLVFTYAKASRIKVYLITIFTFMLVGLWHGANWTYIIFGLIHGSYIAIGTATVSLREKITQVIKIKNLGKTHDYIQMLMVFFLACFSFVFFRSNTVTQAVYILKEIFTNFSIKQINVLDTTGFATILCAILSLLIIEATITTKKQTEELYKLTNNTIFSAAITASLIVVILAFGSVESVGFIYFQF